ncbi:MAG: tripartite tricarboxylate transporter TctB family protein [Burkholderiaceae bacterium]|nr:tripartite tricarboxylate transporter TctB family protein [Burkholderiaceae bacterium]
MSDNNNSQDRAAATYRTVEMAVAAAAFVFGAIIAADSLRLGAGWADDGPQAGYFPFYIGLVICAASAWIFVSTWHARERGREPFVMRGQLRQIMTLLLPSIAYVIAIEFIGIYVASTIFIGYFMWRHGGHRAATAAAVAIGLPAALFMLFERWFRTPLPKGPLEALFGLN